MNVKQDIAEKESARSAKLSEVEKKMEQKDTEHKTCCIGRKQLYLMFRHP